MAIKTSGNIGNVSVTNNVSLVPAENQVYVDNEGAISLEKVEETRNTFDLALAREKYKQEIIASGEVDKLTSLIDLSNTSTILEFGKVPALEMSKVADQVMSKYDMEAVKCTSTLIEDLVEVMKQVDIGDIKGIESMIPEKPKKSLFTKFRESAEEKLNRLVGKYQNLGTKMESICTQLTVYEQQVKESNKDIARMYEQAKDNYKQLTAYILAGEQACIEIEDYRKQRQTELEETGNTNLQFEIQSLNQALTLMEQRVADLRSAEALALQSVPTFKIQEYTNANLARKINSAFIITVPAFKNALVTSVISKQQAIQMQGLMALDEANKVLVRQNADNAVKQLQASQRLANSSAVGADDIEYAWNTLMNGIKSYKEMEEQFREIRKEEARRIEEANTQYLSELASGSSI